jgi:hypothetical protein
LKELLLSDKGRYDTLGIARSNPLDKGKGP